MSHLLTVSGLTVHFGTRARLFEKSSLTRAVDGIDLTVAAGETVGIVGESGCGKSTFARAVIGLIKPTAGQVFWRETELTALSPRALRRYRQPLQIVFQDPLASLDPRLTVGRAIAEPLENFEPNLSRQAMRQRVAAMLEAVGLSMMQINRYPHELSGGQCQRVGIARAMVIKPTLLICDEPVSALDVSIQAQIINLLMAMQQQYQLALLFIAHDLSVVRHISHRVMVMYQGKVVELAPSGVLYAQPRHPYTQLLLASVPVPDPPIERAKLLQVKPEPVGVSQLPLGQGCAFRDRCSMAQMICEQQVPRLLEVADGVKVACHLAQN